MSAAGDIKTLLAEQVGAYRRLLDVLQRERVCLVRFDAAGVESLAKEKDTVVLALRLLEEERVRLAGLLARELGMDGCPTLQQIADRTGDEAYQAYRLQLLSLVQGIAELNGFNRVLIERSSGMVKGALAFLDAFGVTGRRNVSGSLVSREA